MIELKEGVWVYGMWFVDGDDMDWLACIRRVDGKLRLDYRFRYKADDKIWDSKDRKSWYSVTTDNPDAPIEPLIEATHKVAGEVGKKNGTKPDFLLLDCEGGTAKLMFLMGTKEWTHVKHLSREEAEREFGPID